MEREKQKKPDDNESILQIQKEDFRQEDEPQEHPAEMPKEEGKGKGRELFKKVTGYMKWPVIAIVLGYVLSVFVIVYQYEEEKAAVRPSRGQAAMTEAGKTGQRNKIDFTEQKEAVRDTEKDREREPAEAEVQTEKKAEPKETIRLDAQAVTEETNARWQEVIFGEKRSGVAASITVSGLTGQQKARMAFRESDFVQAASGYLRGAGIQTNKIEFQEEIGCSSENAWVFRAALDGEKEKALYVLLYADYPGKFIFFLQDLSDIITAAGAENAQPETGWVQPQPVQIQTEALQTESPKTEASYDATRLSIQDIPVTLLNYLSNKYELQYSLYDYLYRNGYRSVTWASVSEYEILADTGEAKITFFLSDGSNLTGIYKRSDNTYTYH